MVRPLPARHPVGFRRDGRPIYPILGASSEDEANDQLGDAGDDSPEPQVTVTQDRLGKLLTREKAQGERAAIKRLLATLGFDTPKALAEFVTAQREAEQAALTDVERREQAAADRELQAVRREELAAERERAALRRGALVALGASGEDLTDAERLLISDADADETQIQAAAEALRARRPELFGEIRTPPVPAAPAGAPAGRAPTRTAPPPRPGAAGLEMARRRGLVTESGDAR
ncbi:hypothetical protein BIV25_13185 [Streptomyces sp. MUSC 14]|uniref:hypothetical protein n=1 Tax=Streptomyces sp. MUSC 14 TaxID=1354889 RepID=UPI0008F587B5|nr:hypothetical protein [Streptomyces sp. MUSC 14]OIJ97756.1 hypothetical protein BIV25_13185 [Streptomyces sp. MUSC 14]